MFSSGRKGQVEPLPALLALAVFAIGLSLYGVTLDGLPVGSDPGVTDGTMDVTVRTLSEGPVIVPERMDRLSEELPEDVTVLLRADGRTWHGGNTGDTDTNDTACLPGGE